MEVLIKNYGQNDEQIPQPGDQVHAQEEAEQEWLLLWVFREAQEQEVRDAAVVSNFL